MANVSTYLNFPRHTEEVFNFYKSVFGGDFEGGIMRFGDISPEQSNMPVTDEDKELVMHVSLPILDGHRLMGTDAPESMGFKVNMGNNMYITLSPDSKDETIRLFNALSDGGQVEMELQDTFWGDYYGSCKDKYGVQWMFSFSQKQN